MTYLSLIDRHMPALKPGDKQPAAVNGRHVLHVEGRTVSVASQLHVGKRPGCGRSREWRGSGWRSFPVCTGLYVGWMQVADVA